MKIDLINNTKNCVTKSEAVGLARKYGMEYFEAWYSILLIFLLYSQKIDLYSSIKKVQLGILRLPLFMIICSLL